MTDADVDPSIAPAARSAAAAPDRSVERSAGPPVRSRDADVLALFAVMWALAMVWHLLGNPTQAPWGYQAAVAVAAGATIWRPRARLPLAALAVSCIATTWAEAPVTGNHWVLAALLNVGVLLALGVSAVSGRPDARERALLPTLRLGFLGFYSFAAFSKLNSGFFDRSVSCAVVFFEGSARSVGLGSLDLAGPTWVQWALIYGTTIVELAVPIGLLVPRTRRFTVVAAIAFHAVLAIDQDHTFFDFSALVTALYVTFLPAAGPAATAWAGRLGDRLRRHGDKVPTYAHGLAAAVPALAGLMVAARAFPPGTTRTIGWWLWQVAVVTLVVWLGALIRGRRDAADGVAFVPRPLVMLLIPALVVFNGLTPYLEIKTGQGWNMYGNLVTVDGESNHFVVRRTLPLTDEQARPVRVLASDDPDLARYVDDGYLITWRQFRRYLADHPDVAVTFERDGEVTSVDRAGDHPELVDSDPAWREKLQLFRVIDEERPPRCVTSFGPAR